MPLEQQHPILTRTWDLEMTCVLPVCHQVQFQMIMVIWFQLLIVLPVIEGIQTPRQGLIAHLKEDRGQMSPASTSCALVFESFYLLDTSSAPVLIIVASDASHQGNLKQHPLYCKSA